MVVDGRSLRLLKVVVVVVGSHLRLTHHLSHHNAGTSVANGLVIIS